MTPMPEIARRASMLSDRLIIRDADVPHLVVHEWERDGVQHVAWPGDGQTPPYDACRIGLKLFNFPTGQIRIIDFPTGARTPWHKCRYQDAVFYGLTATQVEFVNQAVHYAHPGDASIHPEGTMHHSETIVGGTRLEIGYHPRGISGRDLVAIAGRDLTVHAAHDSVEDGRCLRRWDAEATAREGHYHLRLFALPGYELIEAHYPAGATLGHHIAAQDRIVYVVSGQLRVTCGEQEGEVGLGDCYRIAAGQTFARHIIAPAVVLDAQGAEAPWAYCLREED
jgi:quercetin dioxygenase-like cupin family protein